MVKILHSFFPSVQVTILNMFRVNVFLKHTVLNIHPNSKFLYNIEVKIFMTSRTNVSHAKCDKFLVNVGLGTLWLILQIKKRHYF
jgi:hypothetical protein